MNKSAIYTTLLFVFIGCLAFLAAYNLEHHEIALEANGLQFVEASKVELIESNVQHPVLFIITDKAAQEKRLYKTNGGDLENANDWMLHRAASDTISNKSLFLAALSEGFVFHEFAASGKEEKFQIVAPAPQLEGLRLLQYTAESGFFGFIDDSAFIFFVFATLLFFLLWFADILGYFVQHFIHPSAKLVLHLLALGAAIAFFSLTNIATWMPASFNALLVRNTIFLLFGYVLFQFILKRYVTKMDFLDGELAKFLTLFIGLVGLFFLGNVIGHAIDVNHYDLVLSKPIKAGSHVAIGLIFSFTLGNLLNNLRKRWLYLRANNRLLKQSKQESLKSQAELEALQSSINPHFLYNSLNAIASLAKTDADKTEQMALSLSAFYQYVTNKEEQPTSTLAQELEMIQHYLAIEKIRFADRLEVEIACSEAALACRLPRFSLQPLVENAVKYGFQKDKIQVKIAAEKQKNRLQLHVFDSGKAFDADLRMGYGLQNVSKKLQLLFPNRHRLEFVNAPAKCVFIEVEQ